jgi:hypothetical protein
LIEAEMDAFPGLDRLDVCLPWLEKVYANWQAEGGAANFPLIVAAASPCSATIFHCAGWPKTAGDPGRARHTVLAAIEADSSTKNADTIAIGLSLLLGPKGCARQQRDADEVRKAGATPLCVALLAPGGDDDVEMMITTVAVVPQVLH